MIICVFTKWRVSRIRFRILALFTCFCFEVTHRYFSNSCNTSYDVTLVTQTSRKIDDVHGADTTNEHTMLLICPIP